MWVSFQFYKFICNDLGWFSSSLGASFDKTECTRWVGETCLAATAPTASSAVGRSEFLQLWKDCLPESWRDDATLSKLSAGSFESPNPTTIFFVDTSQRTQASHAPVAGTGAAKPKTKTTRNWHELLKNQKRWLRITKTVSLTVSLQSMMLDMSKNMMITFAAQVIPSFAPGEKCRKFEKKQMWNKRDENKKEKEKKSREISRNKIGQSAPSELLVQQPLHILA